MPLKYHARPAESELTEAEKENGFHVGKWKGMASYRCNKCKFNSLIQVDTELHYFYKHIVQANTVAAMLQTQQAVEVPLLDHRGQQVAALAKEIEGTAVVLPRGYKPPAVVQEVLTKAKGGRTDN